MNNYILFDRVLKCSIVGDTSKYNLIFAKCKRKFKFFDKYQNYVSEKNRLKTHEETKKHIVLLLEKEEKKRTKLAEMGIKFDFPGFQDIINKHKKLDSNKKPAKVTEKAINNEKVVEKVAEKVAPKIVEKSAPKTEKVVEKSAPKAVAKAEKVVEKSAPKIEKVVEKTPKNAKVVEKVQERVETRSKRRAEVPEVKVDATAAKKTSKKNKN